MRGGFVICNILSNSELAQMFSAAATFFGVLVQTDPDAIKVLCRISGRGKWSMTELHNGFSFPNKRMDEIIDTLLKGNLLQKDESGLLWSSQYGWVVVEGWKELKKRNCKKCDKC